MPQPVKAGFSQLEEVCYRSNMTTVVVTCKDATAIRQHSSVIFYYCNFFLFLGFNAPEPNILSIIGGIIGK